MTELLDVRCEASNSFIFEPLNAGEESHDSSQTYEWRVSRVPPWLIAAQQNPFGNLQPPRNTPAIFVKLPRLMESSSSSHTSMAARRAHQIFKAALRRIAKG